MMKQSAVPLVNVTPSGCIILNVLCPNSLNISAGISKAIPIVPAISVAQIASKKKYSTVCVPACVASSPVLTFPQDGKQPKNKLSVQHKLLISSFY